MLFISRCPSTVAIRRDGRRGSKYYDDRPAKFYNRPCALSPPSSLLSLHYYYYYYYYCREVLFIFVVYPYPSRPRTEPMPDNRRDFPATLENQFKCRRQTECIFFPFLVATGGRTSDETIVLFVIPTIVYALTHAHQSSSHCRDSVGLYTATLT